ncbi:MAG: SDR family NAD(P)-dependent oxidoreductase [Pyrobaculum sp.]
MRLVGKNVVVVGVGPGLGSAVVYLLLKEGASVYAFARTVEFLRQLEAEYSRYGFVKTGARDFSKLQETPTEVDGVVHGLVVTAGGYVSGSIDELREGELEDMLSRNLRAHLYAVKAFLPLMRQGSSIVLTSSIGGTYAVWPRHVAYVASKAALAKAVEALAAELLDRGIRVNAVAPGGMTRDLKPGRGYSLGDPQAPPEEVAKVVVWLLTEEASWVTGAVIPVDGGRRFKK